MIVDTLLVFWILFLILCCVFGFCILFAAFITGVPCVPTSKKISDAMMNLAQTKKGETLYDFGSGYGDILFRAPKHCRRIGFERVKVIHWISRLHNKWRRDTVEFRCADFYKADVSDADVISCYLIPHLMKRVKTEVWPKLPTGCRLVSHAFSLPDTKPVKIVEIGSTKLFLYQKS